MRSAAGTSSIIDARDARSALDAFAELPGWLASVMAPGRVADALREAVPELSGPRFRLTGAVVDKLRAKGTEWLAHCRVDLLDDGDPTELVLVGGLVPPGPAAAVQPSTVPFGQPGWRCWLPGLRLHLEVQEADTALPALPRLVDADEAAAVLQQALRDAGHDVEVAGCVPHVVRYKPGSRCTIVYDMSYRGVPGPDPLVAKTHRGDKGRTAWEAMGALWQQHAETDEVVTLAEPLAYLPEERVLVQGPVPEDRTLKDLAREALTDAASGGPGPLLDDLRTALDRTATALAALHRSAARYGREATWDGELAEVREVVARLASTVPHVGAAADPLLARLEDLAGSVPAGSAVCAHGTFRPAQVLLHDGRVGFIDFDSACQAEPALDLGRFRAGLHDVGISAWCASGAEPFDGPASEAHLRLVDELCDEFVATYRRYGTVDPERVVLWETTDVLTALLHAWTKVRTKWLGPRLAVLRHAVEALSVPAPG